MGGSWFQGAFEALTHKAPGFAGGYLLLHLVAQRPGVRAGFIHIPYLPVQAARFPNAPSMRGEDVVRALSIVLEVAATQREDERFGAGTLD
ncbi:hypothetical protein [Dyella sp.]|uniref:pyroglutamyl-peptidase I family protein n=1 Tax=Dyella sp. TaxID=1869338 RepID=UPI002B4760C1|nr:hypothetical protein [Dyella sp.]HKT29929.1 hypothetical protein [Dyella sp.]